MDSQDGVPSSSIADPDSENIMDASSVLQCFIRLSERAANIARAIRGHSDVFDNLVQEKEFDKRRQKPDYKTLADVTIQESIRHFMAKEFPLLSSQVRGEESYCFMNKTGGFINIQIMPDSSLMTDLLQGALVGDHEAAADIAKAIYAEPDVSFVDWEPTKSIDLKLPQDKFGVWVDPLDATAEYISGHDSKKFYHGVFLSGLQCVTILIGMFDLRTGEPVMGVINQPFYSQDKETNKWKSRLVWGFAFGGTKVHSGIRSERPEETSKSHVVIMSSSETDAIKDALDEEFTTIYANGAGYKFLSVAVGLADAYILSRATTFKWDSCAPHAILRSVGGGVCDLSKALTGFDLENEENNRKFDLQYLHPDNPDAEGQEAWLNAGGILAYAHTAALEKIIAKLQQVMREADEED